MPALAPRPMATVIASGVARPSAQGQAITSTLTADSSPRAIRGCGPNADQSRKVSRAIASTIGTKMAEILSASCSIGARCSCASRTRRVIRATSDPDAAVSASMTSAPEPLIAPPSTRSPAARAAGIGSPVSSDSSQVVEPSRMIPSVGIRPPGRTRSRSPACTMASGIVSPPGSRSAVGGDRSIKARIAAVVPRRARLSSNWPSSTSTTIMPDDSKKTSTLPSGRRNASGTMPGTTVATVLVTQATSTPSAISENIVGRPRRNPARPPERIGQPPQKTIGVAKSSCSQLAAWPASQAETPEAGARPVSCPSPCVPWPVIPSIATAISTKANPPQITSRRRSWLRAAPAPGSWPIGSSGIPQMLQVPGDPLVTWGCIGHRQPYSPAAAFAQQGLTGSGTEPGWMTSSCILLGNYTRAMARRERKASAVAGSPRAHGAHGVRHVRFAAQRTGVRSTVRWSATTGRFAMGPVPAGLAAKMWGFERSMIPATVCAGSSG